MTYTYDPVGNPTQILDSNGDLAKYGYDTKCRLTSANFTPVSNKFYTYTYDAVDNRTFSSENGATTFTFNAAGQITVGNAIGKPLSWAGSSCVACLLDNLRSCENKQEME